MKKFYLWENLHNLCKHIPDPDDDDPPEEVDPKQDPPP
jgi:hypothetical protein